MAAADLTLCPDCGRSIPRDAVRGMCMACMMRAALPGFLSDVSDESDSSDSFGPWRILSPAGEGAFGLVYEAEQHTPLHRRAALKVLKPGLSSREVLARFAAEREALAVLDHPGIARVLDAGEDAGRPWFAAEWVDGAQSLTAFCQNQNLPRRERVRLFQSVCEAVAHAHQRGIIHRDLKPSNILVSADGAAKVIDFGIARATEQVLAQSTLVTLAGQVLGTPAYMSPEQAAGQGAEADTRSDIYSLGAVLYELLAGQPPFPRAKLESVSLHEALRIVREDAPAKPSTLDPALRGELEWITLKALEKDPARRYETAAALARDLGHWLDGGTVLAAPPSRAYQLRTFLRRHRTAAIGVAAVFVALLAGLAGTTLMFLRARGQSTRAEGNEAAARRNASRGDHQTAQTFFDKGEPVTAVMHLARAVRTDPTNHTAAERLLAELAWTDFPRLAFPPVELAEFIRLAGFSPDGTRLAVQCNEVNFAPGFVALFDVATGAQLAAWRDGTHHFAFSPDSKSLALAQAGGAVTFWNAADGTALAAPPVLVHTAAVRHVAWMTAARMATVEDGGDKTSTGRLWDLSSQKVLAAIHPVQTLAAPAVSPDGSRIAWVQYDGTVCVLDTETGTVIATWQTPGHGSAAFAGDSDRLAVQTFGGPLRFFRVGKGAPFGEPVPAHLGLLVPAFAPDGGTFVTAGPDGHAIQWNALTQQPGRHFPGMFFNTQFSANGALLVLGGDLQRDVLLRDVLRDRPARAPVPVPGNSYALALSPDGRWLACGGRQRRLMLCDLQPRAARPQLLTFPGPLWHAAWSGDGKFLAALGTNGQCAVWDGRGAELEPDAAWPRAVSIAAPGTHAAGLRKSDYIAPGDPALAEMVPEKYRGGLAPETLLSAAISPDGQRLALGTVRREIHVFDLRAENPPLVLTLPRSPQQVAFSSAGTQLAAGLSDGVVMRFDPASGAETGRWPAHTTRVTALAFLPDDRVVSGAEGKGVAISPPGARVMVPAAVRQLAVSPDGKWIAAGLDDGSALICDAATGIQTGAIMRHLSVVGPAGLLLRFSPDSRTLATAGSFDNTARLWEIPSCRERAVLPHTNNVDVFTFDSTGRRFATVTMEKMAAVLRVWDTATALPLLPPCYLPAGEGYMSAAFHPDSTRLAVTGGRGAVLLYDLPPFLTSAPPWLADAAEAWTGWRFDDSGLPVPCISAASFPDNDAWADWLAAVPSSRPTSPFSPQTQEQYTSLLRGVGTLEAYQEIHQFHPSPADTLMLKVLPLLKK